MKQKHLVKSTLDSHGLALFVIPVLILVVAMGCEKEESLGEDLDKLGRATGPVENRKPSPMARTPQSEGAKGPPKFHEGKVTEVINVPKYTYIKLATSNGEIWTAVPSAKVVVGDQVKIRESMVMQNWQSPSTKRTFESVVFGMLAGSPTGGPPNETGNGETPAPEPGNPQDPTKLPKGYPPAGHPPMPN